MQLEWSYCIAIVRVVVRPLLRATHTGIDTINRHDANRLTMLKVASAHRTTLPMFVLLASLYEEVILGQAVPVAIINPHQYGTSVGMDTPREKNTLLAKHACPLGSPTSAEYVDTEFVAIDHVKLSNLKLKYAKKPCEYAKRPCTCLIRGLNNDACFHRRLYKPSRSSKLPNSPPSFHQIFQNPPKTSVEFAEAPTSFH